MFISSTLLTSLLGLAALGAPAVLMLLRQRLANRDKHMSRSLAEAIHGKRVSILAIRFQPLVAAGLAGTVLRRFSRTAPLIGSLGCVGGCNGNCLRFRVGGSGRCNQSLTGLPTQARSRGSYAGLKRPRQAWSEA